MAARQRYRVLCEGGWKAAAVSVEMVPAAAWPADVASAAKRFWAAAKAERPFLFNGSIAALEYYAAAPERLHLCLRPATYGDLLYSNARAGDWLASGQARLLCRALGVSAVVATADARLILLRRSARVGEYPGAMDVVGGHLDPAKHRGPEALPDPFAAIADEIETELGVAPDLMSSLTCLGLVENSELGKPELIFAAGLQLPAAELISRAAAALETDEFDQVFSISSTAGALAAFLQRHREEFSPSAEGALRQYCRCRRFR